MEQVQTYSNNNQQNNQVKTINKCCEVCKQVEKQLMRCARCKVVYYCSAQCQKKHWPMHKINCSRVKQQGLVQNLSKLSGCQYKPKQQHENQFHGLNEFGKLKHLGSGNFSQIFKATSKTDGKTYAIKQVQKAKVQRIRKQADLFMEKHCLGRLKDCEYTIKLYKTFQDQLNLFIQMECPQNGELWEQCRTFGLFSQPVFKYYAAHLVRALSIIHGEYEIVHRDLKPQNILLDQSYRVKLIDFGTAKDLSRPDIQGSGNGLKGKKPFQHYVGTPNYMAPQCIHNKASQKKSDIYSLSGVLYFMKTGAPPFTGGSQFIVFKKSLQNQLFCCPQLFSSQLKDLLHNMNKKSMHQRYDIKQVMQHEYFKQIDFANLPSYQQVISKCTDIQKFLYNNGKLIFDKYHNVAMQGELKQRKEICDREIQPLLEGFKKQSLPEVIELSQEQRKWLQQRIQIMKIQVKVMMNYYDNNSSGFAEIYNNDFDSAQKIIKQVRADGKKKQNNDNQDIQNQNNNAEDQQQDGNQEINMKKNKQSQGDSKQTHQQTSQQVRQQAQGLSQKTN